VSHSSFLVRRRRKEAIVIQQKDPHTHQECREKKREGGRNLCCFLHNDGRSMSLCVYIRLSGEIVDENKFFGRLNITESDSVCGLPAIYFSSI
jgi:hypothetical protein